MRQTLKRTALLGLALLLLLSGCGGGETPETPVPAQPTVPAQEDQRRILEENRALWAFDEVGYQPEWYYTVTDLDRNGLLEVLAASTQGSGIFTYVHFYEVLPDGSGLRNLCQAETEGPDDWPEIVQDSLSCYYDRASDRCYYVCANLTRDGAAHSVTLLSALCLKDGVAEWEALARMDVELTEAGEQTKYTDSVGTPISEQDYQTAAERRFAGMERSELRLDWTAGTSQPPEPERQDGERFETCIQIEGMEETVRYEHIRNEALGFELDYDYERFTRHIEAGRECFVSIYDDPQNPENYLELRSSPEDAETAAETVRAALSQEYELLEQERTLDRAGACIRIEASEEKGTGRMAEQLQVVYLIPAPDGCRIATAHYAIEAAEGFGRRFSYLLNTLAVIERREG